MTAMQRIVHLEVRRPYRLFVRFDDGTEGEDDPGPRLRGPMFEPLRDPKYFARVTLSDYGAPLWPNGLDLAPDGIYERIRRAATTTRAGRSS